MTKLKRLLTLREVMELTTLSRATIYRKMELGTFPKPVQISKRRVAWRTSDVNAWIDAKLAGQEWEAGDE
ncbi:AlpA family transcriptional regulator [Neiella marina]|uniref:AlpA family transcriptional regulator n=1 Tax=Neiella holothuriorum TaxID=2870530 RepID=A0ABS7EHR6_9GAMM|nr:AlpA family transcriptional regulator [Neiella holothuriorum]MBW8191438.1 AlpA family transcriptional regulator [Neiella holothuriorum]